MIAQSYIKVGDDRGSIFALTAPRMVLVAEVENAWVCGSVRSVAQATLKGGGSCADILIRLNAQIYGAAELGVRGGKGTSAIVAAADENYVVVAHAGACEGWLIRDEEVVRLSSDQSLAMDALDRTGTVEQYLDLKKDFPTSVVSVLGLMSTTRIDVRYVGFRTGDRVALLAGDAKTSRAGHMQLARTPAVREASRVVEVLTGAARTANWAVGVLSWM